MKVLKQVHQDASEPAVLVGSPIAHDMAALLRANDVTCKLAESETLNLDAKVEVLHGEERREIFTVPTCQFRDDWLECWIVPEKRTIVPKGKVGTGSRDVLPQLKEVLRNNTDKNRIISSVLQHWKVADFREVGAYLLVVNKYAATFEPHVFRWCLQLVGLRPREQLHPLGVCMKNHTKCCMKNYTKYVS